MPGAVEFIEDGVQPSPLADPEKVPQVTTERFGDQISHAKLEELAPNGEGDYILEIINNMTEDEAIEIIKESVKFHADDWNFPSEMRARMIKLLEGPKSYGEFYERDLRIDACMMRYSSPYPGVRAVASPLDDDKVPIETFRAYFLGIGWAVIGTFMSTFFNSRFPSISKCRLSWSSRSFSNLNPRFEWFCYSNPPIPMCQVS
jgi:hypothetical protein